MYTYSHDQILAIDEYTKGLLEVFKEWSVSADPFKVFAGLQAIKIITLHHDIAELKFKQYDSELTEYIKKEESEFIKYCQKEE
jgi:hypothetical protein